VLVRAVSCGVARTSAVAVGKPGELRSRSAVVLVVQGRGVALWSEARGQSRTRRGKKTSRGRKQRIYHDNSVGFFLAN